MEREKLSIKSLVIKGLINGLLFAIFMAAFDFFTNEPFSWIKFLIHGLFFGIFMAIAFRFSYSKKKE